MSGFRILPPSESVNCCRCQVLPPRERCSFSFLSFLSFFAPPWLQQLLHWFSTLCSSCTNLILMMQETYTETRDVTDNGGSVFSCTYSLSYDPNTAKVFLPPPIKPSTCPFPIRPYFPIHPYIEKVYRQESSVSCDPNTNGKQTEELLIIEVMLLLESKSMIVLQSKTVFFE